jgi:hypothetical protein
MDIKFVSIVTGDPTLPKPIPASKKIPEWYKSIPRYLGNEKKPPLDSSGTAGTVKACMPVLDSISSGYLILSSADIFIQKNEGVRHYTWADYNLITFHAQEQVSGYPNLEKKLNLENVPKFNNYWIVQTPKNYSSLFITPFHHDLPFTILPAIVDTDTYFNPVNFPFFPDPDFEGLIPKGTPIAQVLPFKRDDWEMSIENVEDSKIYQKNFLTVLKTLHTQFFDKYKKNNWIAKTYK